MRSAAVVLRQDGCATLEGRSGATTQGSQSRWCAFRRNCGRPPPLTGLRRLAPDQGSLVRIALYKRKVEAYIRANENHVAIAKLRFNKPLTASDLSELERFVYQSDAAESRERFQQCYGQDCPLAQFIRSLVGLDRSAAKEAFGAFLDTNRYSSQQIRFVEMIIDRLTQGGIMDPGQLYEPPFTCMHYQGLDGLFPDQDAAGIVEVLAEVNLRAAA